jgi:TPR repeat protein
MRDESQFGGKRKAKALAVTRRGIRSDLALLSVATLLILLIALFQISLANAQTAPDAPATIDAQRQQGENLITGWGGVKQNKAEGVKLLDDAIAKGDPKSSVTLGKLLMDGQFLKQDRNKALFLVQNAARMGNFEGVEAVGETLMWTGRTADDRREAERLLYLAGTSGRGSAWTTLAYGAIYGRLGKADGAKYATYAEKARALGSTQIEVVEAERLLYGLGTKKNAARVVTNLEAAAANGNPDAIKFLIKLFRDGSRPDVKKNLTKAQAYFDTYGQKLPAADQQQQTLLLKIARATKLSEFVELSRAIRARPDFQSVDFQKQINSANWYFSVYLAQQSLKRRKQYSGPLDGRVTKKSFLSIQRACRVLPLKADCSDKNVLSGKTLALIILN